ncbi:MAG: hypothetical protein QM690_21475 [Sphingobium sp.]
MPVTSIPTPFGRAARALFLLSACAAALPFSAGAQVPVEDGDADQRQDITVTGRRVSQSAEL